MDVLGDIGARDQLIATRTENQLLKVKVETLTQKVDDLTLQVAVLQAEVELYREEARHSTTSTVERASSYREDGILKKDEAPFVFQLPSTRHSYCSTPQQVFPDRHGRANPTCVACPTDASSGTTILVTGGADASICFTPMADPGLPTTTSSPTLVHLSAPVVCLDAMEYVAPWDIVVAAGTMDGHIHCAVYSSHSAETARTYASSAEESVLKKHGKYVSAISWSRRGSFPSAGATSKEGRFLGTASADGTVHIYFVNESDDSKLQMQHVESLYFDDAVTCLCFTNYTGSGVENDIVLYAYVRNTPHLKVIRMPTSEGVSSCTITTLHLNASLFDDHVSFAVLDLKRSANEKYVAAACDNHCHLILENRIAPHPKPLANIVRKLYGHTADAYSRPVVAWSHDGHYVYCNTQQESKLCIYSIASGALLDETVSDTSGGHARPIKDLQSHPHKKLLVTTSFDRNTILWVPREEL
jgi:WD40 repeat protein